jgi:hypothetical protein
LETHISQCKAFNFSFSLYKRLGIHLVNLNKGFPVTFPLKTGHWNVVQFFNQSEVAPIVKENFPYRKEWFGLHKAEKKVRMGYGLPAETLVKVEVQEQP